MRFLETLSGGHIAVSAISSIDPYKPEKGARWYVVHYNQGEDYGFVHPEIMDEFFGSEGYHGNEAL